MVQPHPSLLLVLDIDDSLATKKTRLEINRCYGYVGSTVVRPHAGSKGKKKINTMEMHVKLPGAKYMRDNSPEADELWNEVIERWLFNQFHTVGNHMQIYNRRQREEGNEELYFDWLNVIFEAGAFTARIKLDSVSSLPPECSKVIAQIREALCNGDIAQDVEYVYVPSPRSYRRQLLEWEADAPQRETARLEAERVLAEEAAKKEEAAAAAAAQSFDEDPALAPKEEDYLDEESWQEELERKYSLPAPDFEIDYSIWGVVGAGGEVRDYDSNAQSYIEPAE